MLLAAFALGLVAIIQCAAGQEISNDGSCGGPQGLTCAGSEFGQCCSRNGWWGDSNDHCQSGCQAPFGVCAGGDGNSPGQVPPQTVQITISQPASTVFVT